MQNNQPSQHLLRITIHVTHISLSVRFPCTLQLSLKNNLQIVSSKSLTELKQGQCSPNQKLTLDAEVPFNNKAYFDKNIAILVSMISSSGKIPAGCVEVKITDQGKILQTRDVVKRDIEKCPDRNASMELSITVEFIRALARNNSLNMQQVDKQSHSRVLSYSDHHQNWEQIRKTNNSQNANMRIKGNRNLSEIRQNSNALRKSPIKIDCAQQQINDHSIIQDQILLTSHKPINTNTNTKELQKIKSELTFQKKQSQYKINNLQDQLIKYKTQIDILTQEHLQNKNKIKIIEKNQKQLQNQNKDYKQQLIKCKNKISLFEKNIQQNKIQLETNEKAFVALQKQLSQQKQQIQQKNLSITALEKKVQYKQSTLNEHCNKIMEKYQNSENERLKAVKQLNQMLMQYESREKRMQLASKEKQRDHLDEKNKFTKRIELLIIQNQELTEKVSEFTAFTLSLQSEINFSTTQKVKLQEELSNVSEKLSLSTHTSHTQYLTLQQQKQTLSLHDKQVQQSNILNKKHTQIQLEYNRVKQVCSKLETKVQSMSKENIQIESQLKNCKSELEKVESKAGQLGREVQRYKKITEGKDAQIQSLQQTNMNLSNKLGELRIKVESSSVQHQTILNRLSGQILFLHKTNQSLKQQLQQQNNSLTKIKQLNNQQCFKNQQLNKQILKLTEQIYLQQEKVRKTEQLKKETDIKIQTITIEIKNKQDKQKLLQTQIRQKNQQEHNQIKIIKQKQQDLYILKSQFQTLQSTYSQSQQQIETLSSKLSVLTQRLTQQQITNSTQNNSYLLTISDQNKKMEKLELERKYNQNVSEELKIAMQKQEKVRDQKDKQIQLLKEKLNQELIKVQKLQKKLKTKQVQNDNNKKDFTKYKEDNYAAIEKFMIEINKDIVNTTTSISYQTHILTFPDNNINLLQIQSLKKKHELLLKYIQQIQNKDEQIKILNIQTQKLQQLHKQRQEELESQVLQVKNKIKQLQYETMSQSSELLQKMHAIEEKNVQKCSQNDKLTQQLHLLTQSYEELQLSHSQAITNLNESSTAYQSLQQKLQASLFSYNTLQSHTDHQIQIIGQENKNQIEKYKGFVKEMEKKNGELEKQLEQRGKRFQQMVSKNGQLQGELQRMCQKILAGEGRLDEYNVHKRQLEERIFQQQAKTAEQINQKEKLQQQISSERLKAQQLNLQIKSLSQSLHSLQTEHSALQFQYTTLKSVTSSQSTLSQQSLSQSQQTIQKLTESISNLQQQIIKYKSQNELQMFINEQLKQTSADSRKEMKSIQKQLEEKKLIIVKLKEQLEDIKNQYILAKEDIQADKVERERVETESRRYRETIQEMNEQVQQQSALAQLLQQKSDEFSQLQVSYKALQRANELIKQQHSQCQIHLKKNSQSHYSREEQYKNKIAQLQNLLEISRQEGERLGTDVQSLDQESGQLRNKISQLERQLADMNITIASKCQQLEQSEKTAKLLSIQIKTMTEQKEKKPHNVNNTSIYQQLVKDIDGRATRNNRAN